MLTHSVYTNLYYKSVLQQTVIGIQVWTADLIQFKTRQHSATVTLLLTPILLNLSYSSAYSPSFTKIRAVHKQTVMKTVHLPKMAEIHNI